MPTLDASIVHVVIESGTKRAFASALEWPGWARSGRDEAAALATLSAYAARYRPVARLAHLRFPAKPTFEVVERLRGGGSTDFGVPDAVAVAERERPTLAEARRVSALVEATWVTLDEIAATAPPTLRKGPRGGGRDRDQIVQHVLSPEAASYARAIGLRLAEPTVGDRQAIAAARAAIAEAIRAGGRKDAPATRWPIRYAARRIAWLVLDHAWEIEEKSAS
jgi:hypothetical protein